MAKNDILWRASSMLVAESNRALLATADGSGKPHSTYMNVLADSSMEEVVSITAPDTEKIKNLKENPYAEWMFSSSSLESVVYLSGPTKILSGEEATQYWDSMPGKSKAYYRHYCDEDRPEMFAIIRTRVEKILYCRPPGYRKTLVYEL